MHNFTIKYNVRAKNLRLKVSSLGKVEVVSPPKVPTEIVQQFVNKNEAWISQAIEKAQSGRLSDVNLGAQPPVKITLKAISQTYHVEYYSTLARAHIKEEDSTLAVFSMTCETRLALLNTWLQKKAKYHLVPWLHDISEVHNIGFNRVTIRGQKTRWGSCSSKKNISLNRNLLFVAPALVNYLMIHELSHVIHLNHSHHFWRQVALCEPNYKVLDHQLNLAQKEVPLWVQLG